MDTIGDNHIKQIHPVSEKKNILYASLLVNIDYSEGQGRKVEVKLSRETKDTNGRDEKGMEMWRNSLGHLFYKSPSVRARPSVRA